MAEIRRITIGNSGTAPYHAILPSYFTLSPSCQKFHNELTIRFNQIFDFSFSQKIQKSLQLI
jgi:hypothetical protein